MESTKSWTWIAFYMVVALGVSACSPEKGRPKHARTTVEKPSKVDDSDYEGEEVVTPAPAPTTTSTEEPKPTPATAPEPKFPHPVGAAPAAPTEPAPTVPENPAVPAPSEEKPSTPVAPPTEPVQPLPLPTKPVDPELPEVPPVAPPTPPVQNPDPFPVTPAPVAPPPPVVPPSEKPEKPKEKPAEKPAEKPPGKPAEKPAEKPPVQHLPKVAYPELPEGWNPVHWEKKSGSGRAWSRIAVGIIRTKAQGFYKGASDMTMFCANYPNLSNAQRENVWVGIISAIARFESNYVPTTYYLEPLKNFRKFDPVTGKRVASEGLLQLSYQDKKSYPKYCGEFDWDRDEDYDVRDPRKSILNPRINLTCGIQIMHHKLLKTNKIAIADRPYWAVLSPTNANSKLDEIVGLVSSLPICKPK